MTSNSKIPSDRKVVEVRIIHGKGGAPIRTIVERAHVKPTGAFLSLTAGCALPWESVHERHFMWISEVDFRVRSFVAQPFRMEFWFQEGGMIAYFPDIERTLDGAIEIIEIKKTVREAARHFISDVTALDHVLGRVDTATLTTSGIRFKYMNFHDEAITSALLEDLAKDAPARSQSDKTYAPARVRVVIKYNPADASRISVCNSGGSPSPSYVTLPNRDPKFEGISFWHWEKIREFAEQQDLDFNSEADRWKARDDLRKRWQNIAGDLPMRESRDARRGLMHEAIIA